MKSRVYFDEVQMFRCGVDAGRRTTKWKVRETILQDINGKRLKEQPSSKDECACFFVKVYTVIITS